MWDELKVFRGQVSLMVGLWMGILFELFSSSQSFSALVTSFLTEILCSTFLRPFSRLGTDSDHLVSEPARKKKHKTAGPPAFEQERDECGNCFLLSHSVQNLARSVADKFFHKSRCISF